MSKKSRRARARAKAKAKYRASLETVGSVPGVPVYRAEPRIETKSVASVDRVSPRAQVAQILHYEYVVPELKRIGIVAGALFIILIILAFLLH